MRRFVAVVALLSVVGCGGERRIGDDFDTDGGPANTNRLGEVTPSPKPTVEVTEGPAATPPPATAPPPTQAPTPAPAVVIRIVPTSEAKGQYFNPQQARVARGSIVRWVNEDSTDHWLKSGDGTFVSPVIPPGQHWDYLADTAGTFGYNDGDRPFANGTLQVV